MSWRRRDVDLRERECLSLCERVDAFHARKAIKVSIIAGDGGGVFQAMQGDQGVRGKVAARACFFQQIEKALQRIFVRNMQRMAMRPWR